MNFIAFDSRTSDSWWPDESVKFLLLSQSVIFVFSMRQVEDIECAEFFDGERKALDDVLNRVEKEALSSLPIFGHLRRV